MVTSQTELLQRWLERSYPNWRELIRLGGDHPGNYFDCDLAAETARILAEDVS